MGHFLVFCGEAALTSRSVIHPSITPPVPLNPPTPFSTVFPSARQTLIRIIMDLESDHSSDFDDQDEGGYPSNPPPRAQPPGPMRGPIPPMAVQKKPEAQVKPVETVDNQHHDEVYEINDDDEEDIPSDDPEQMQPPPQNAAVGTRNQASSPDSDLDTQHQPPGGARAYQPGMEDEEEAAGSEGDNVVFAGAYNPADYAGLNVQAEVKDLFQYITRFKPHHVELETKLKPFIPEYIPSVGEVDAFLKPPKPDASTEELGLTSLDEPKLNQSDPALLELQLRPFIKRPTTGNAATTVHSIELAYQNPKQITRWISSISDVHRSKPPPTISYTKPMPDIDNLMEVWPQEFEEALGSLSLPGPDLEVDLQTYAKIVCAMLDIPVYSQPSAKNLVESLHVLFTLYSDFKSNPHFQAAMKDQAPHSTSPVGGSGGADMMRFA